MKARQTKKKAAVVEKAVAMVATRYSSSVAMKSFLHAYRFSAEGATMRWECERGCGAGGAKRYPTPEAARRYAQAFDRRDTEDLGRRPLLSLLPLWLARRAGRRRG